MKTLILVRHATALTALEARVQKDSERPLSPQGLTKAAETAQKLKTCGYKPRLILHSPLLRAKQTAEILANALGAQTESCTELNGLHEDRDVCELLAQRMQGEDCLAAVGHNPNIAMVLHLYAKQTKHFSPGAFAVLDFDDPHHPKLTRFEDYT